MWSEYGDQRPLWMRNKLSQVEFRVYQAMDRSGITHRKMMRALATLQEPKEMFRSQNRSCRSQYYSSFDKRWGISTQVEHNKLWCNPMIAWRKSKELRVYDPYMQRKGRK